MSTLDYVELVLRVANEPLRIHEIVNRAGDHLPTESKTPQTIVGRDLWRDRQRGQHSRFVRLDTGRHHARYVVRDALPPLRFLSGKERSNLIR